MIIIASGLSGTGKSVLCEKLARYFRLRYVPASGIYKKVREEKLSEMHIGQLKKNVGWWESAEGQRFMEKRLKDPKFDRAVDNTLLRMIEKGNVATDSWTMPWLSKKGFKIWLKASDGVRGERLAKRDRSKNKRQLLKIIRQKEKRTKKIYKKLYGFDFAKDFSPFDLIIDTDALDKQQVFEIAKKAIEKKSGM